MNGWSQMVGGFWDTAAIFLLQCICELYLLYLVGNPNAIQRKETFRKQALGYFENEVWSVYQSNSKRPPAFCIIHFISGLASYSRSRTCCGAERRKLETNAANTLCWQVSVDLSLTTEPRRSCALLWTPTASPLYLFWNIVFHLRKGWE